MYVCMYVCSENKYFFLIGDFNIDCSPIDTSICKNSLLQVTCSNGLFQVITVPTRITTNKHSCIDNCFTNYSNLLLNGTIFCDLSDHLPIFITIDLNKTKISKIPDVNLISKYSFSSHRIDKLSHSLNNEDWQNVQMCNNLNDAFDIFINSYQSKFNEHCLVKGHKKIVQMLKHKPWINKNIKCLMAKKINCIQNI